MGTTPLYDFQISETSEFIKQKEKLDTKLYTKIKNIVYPQLRENPFYGSNIKKLKGKLDGYYRYRIGIYGLFYLIETGKILVVMTSIKHRQKAYG